MYGDKPVGTKIFILDTEFSLIQRVLQERFHCSQMHTLRLLQLLYNQSIIALLLQWYYNIMNACVFVYVFIKEIHHHNTNMQLLTVIVNVFYR